MAGYYYRLLLLREILDHFDRRIRRSGSRSISESSIIKNPYNPSKKYWDLTSLIAKPSNIYKIPGANHVLGSI